MRVLYITGEYPPHQGGVADYTAILRAEMRALDVTSEVLTSADCASTEATVHPVVGTWGFPFWGVAQQILSERRFDVVHIQYQTAAFDLKPAVNLLPWYLQRRARPSGHRDDVSRPAHALSLSQSGTAAPLGKPHAGPPQRCRHPHQS